MQCGVRRRSIVFLKCGKVSLLLLFHLQYYLVKIERKKKKVLALWSNLARLIEENPSYFKPKTNFSFSDFCWGWSCVMTRCIWVDVDSIFTKRDFPEYPFSFVKKNVWALAPLLDGLNHSAASQVRQLKIAILQT
jgi:hypothetical protein